ncbi:hypothetical protein EJ08DRAFT_595018 [Tothia fuscella]|uniref:Methyltransferase type 11 domain-containing protein n=1 Tax=Tothia fuscella TaxID=1048955 RepID=A0A9P4TV07_9PEZI|nr:hypothetical protein EJ08DRAFT_595018 [Tothia fuscella]
MPEDWKVTPYTPTAKTWPYKPADFTRQDESPDSTFYKDAKIVTHIDDNAIKAISRYYDAILPKPEDSAADGKVRILDFCSSWVSHYPARIEQGLKDGTVQVVGMGMNVRELERNPILSERIVQDLNTNPTIPKQSPLIDASTCVVSIDYLTKPLEVLSSLRANTVTGGTVHLAISNRAFWHKVVRAWLMRSEEKRLEMVCDYLWFSGWREVEIVEVVKKGDGAGDPVWVIRGKNLGVV